MIKFGHAVPINDEAKEKRKDVGLDDTPPTVHKFKDALGEVQKLIKISGFDELVADKEETS